MKTIEKRKGEEKIYVGMQYARLSPLKESHLPLFCKKTYQNEEELNDLYIKANSKFIKLFGASVFWGKHSPLLSIDEIADVIKKNNIETGEKAHEMAQDLAEKEGFLVGHSTILEYPICAAFFERPSRTGEKKYRLETWTGWYASPC